MSTVVARHRVPWVSTVSTDAIRHFAFGVGDDNPLWFDPGQSEASLWGRRFAPPCFAYAIDETTVAPGHETLARRYHAVDWTWFDLLTLGTELRPKAELVAEDEVNGTLAQRGVVTFADSAGNVVATAETTTVRSAESLITIDQRPELRYAPADIDAIESRVLDEERRGAETRYVEDVAVGDDLGEVVKGPLSIMDVVAWCTGTQGVATDEDEYSDGGLLAQTATGPQQVAWMAHLLTNWMGDDGFLHRLRVEIIDLPPLGSTTSISGQVAAVRTIDGLNVVEADVVATNQSGEITARGSALILLPLRDGSVSLPLSTAVDPTS